MIGPAPGSHNGRVLASPPFCSRGMPRFQGIKPSWPIGEFLKYIVVQPYEKKSTESTAVASLEGYRKFEMCGPLGPNDRRSILLVSPRRTPPDKRWMSERWMSIWKNYGKPSRKHIPGLAGEAPASSNCGAVGGIHGRNVFPYLAFVEEAFTHSQCQDLSAIFRLLYLSTKPQTSPEGLTTGLLSNHKSSIGFDEVQA